RLPPRVHEPRVFDNRDTAEQSLRPSSESRPGRSFFRGERPCRACRVTRRPRAQRGAIARTRRAPARRPRRQHRTGMSDSATGYSPGVLAATDLESEVRSGGVSYHWRGPLTDAEMVELVATHGGTPTPGWWDRIRPH